MLHEIFKGMDNAAEQINENFKALDVEVGENEDGYYAKFENGLGLCWREVTFVRGSSSEVGNFPKPIIFKDGMPLFGGISSSSFGGIDRIDTWKMIIANYFNSWTIGRNYRDFNAWSGTGELTVVLWAIGFVEE